MNQGRLTERNLQIPAAVRSIAEESDRPPSQVATNRVRRQGGQVLPLIGARTARQLEETHSCLDFTLTNEPPARLNEARRIDLAFPHDFLAEAFVSTVIYRETLPLIDAPRAQDRAGARRAGSVSQKFLLFLEVFCIIIP